MITFPQQGMKRFLETPIPGAAPLPAPSLNDFLPWISSTQLHDIALTSKIYKQSVEDEFSKRINRSAEKILTLTSDLKKEDLVDEYEDEHLTKDPVLKICTFIEKYLPNEIEKGNFYFSRKKTGYACSIEYDPETNGIFLHTRYPLGAGKDKVVIRSIVYDVNQPQLVASTKYVENTKSDIQIKFEFFKKLASVSRIIPFLGALYRQRVNGNIVARHITPLYPLGNLEKFDKSLLSLKDYVVIARDLMEAFRNIHALKIAHNDVFACNVLLEANKDPSLKDVKYRLVLIDFDDSIDPADKEELNNDVRSASKFFKRFLPVDGAKYNEIILDMREMTRFTNFLSADYYYDKFNELLKTL